MNPLITRYLGLWALLLGTICSSQAAFTGAYATNNWTLVNSNANGTLLVTNSFSRAVLTGGDNQSATPGYTEWRVTVPAAAVLQFDWSYSTVDADSGPWDRAGWRVNQEFTEIVRNDSTNRAGPAAVSVNAGDVFAFWVRTGDNLLGPGVFTITNFSAGASLPRFTKSAVSNHTVLLHLQTIPGRTYRVEATTVFPATNWVQIGTNFIATTNLTPVNTTASNFPHRFFRAILLP